MGLEKSHRQNLQQHADASGGRNGEPGYFEVRYFSDDSKLLPRSDYYRTTEDLIRQWAKIEKLNRQGYTVALGVGRRKFNGGKKKDDILYVRVVWVDLDGKDFCPTDIQRGKEMAFETLRQLGDKIQPSCIVDSGNGYHAYWYLAEPVQLDSPQAIQSVEIVNAALATTLGGDHAWDISRVLKLAYTLNLKDPANPKLSTILEIHPERLYKLSDFDHILPPSSGNAATAQPVEVTFSDQVAPVELDSLRISQKMKSLIQTGFQQGQGYKSRSEAMQAVITAMLAKEHTVNEIRAVMRRGDWLIGLRYREERNSADKYLTYCIRNAHRFVEKNRAEEPPRQAGPYSIRNHAMYAENNRSPHPQRISNFEATIDEELIKDDGIAPERFYKMTGVTESGIILPEIRVPVKEYSAMNWPLTHWGKRAVVSAGHAKDKLREAFLLLSRNDRERRIYAHTGWRPINGQHVYLFNGGAIGANDVEVELDSELKRYVLELPKSLEERRDALQLSLQLLDVAPLAITAPLWSAIWLAPFTSFLEPDFMLFLVGVTGSLKSSLLSLIQAHYGTFTKKIHLPASWTSSYAYLELSSARIADAIFGVDDFAPASSKIENDKLQLTAARFIRSVGNRSGRGRATNTLSLRASSYPKGMVISTGEQIPTGGGESTVARLFIVDTQREAMDLSKLTHVQNNVHLLRKATGSFIDLIRPDLDRRVERMNALWEELAHGTQRKGHLRVPEAAAFLRIGAQAGLEAIRDMGGIDAKGYDNRLKACDDAIQELAVRQSDRVQEERPSLKFLRLVHELLVGRQICLNTCHPSGCMQDVGWHDQNFYYLISGLVMDKVKSFSQKSDEYFGLSAKALHKQLYEDGFTIRSESGNRYLVKARIPRKDSVVWALKLKRKAVDQVAEWIPSNTATEDISIEELEREGL